MSDTPAAAPAATPAHIVPPAWAQYLPADFDACPRDLALREDWHRAMTMVAAYMLRYQRDRAEWETVGCEVPYTGDIINPETGAASRTFVMAGLFDKIAKRKDDGTLWLWERKTSSKLGSAYFGKLWLDNQITQYAIYAARKFKEPIAGVVYDVLGKCGIDLKPGESDAEFATRKLGMVKPGAAKQQKPDTDEGYRARLIAWYQQPDKLHREPIMFAQADLDEMTAELWELSKQLIHSTARGFWPKNTSQCHVYERRCDYLDICQSRGNPVTIETMYHVVEGHRELRAAGIIGDDGKIPGDDRMVVTNSMLNAYRNCQRLAKHRYLDHLSPLGGGIRSLVFGNIIHDALEAWDVLPDDTTDAKRVAAVHASINAAFNLKPTADAYSNPNAAAADAFFDAPNLFT